MENVGKKKELVEAAREAAKRGDAAGMVKALFSSGAIDDLVWNIKRQFQRTLAPAVISDCVADAIADCYAALAAGKSISNLVGYLLTAARNSAVDLLAVDGITHSFDRDSLPDQGDQEQDAARDEAKLALRKTALERARSLLPRLGQSSVQAVMGVVFDAVEKEVVDLTDDKIAEITGLLPDTVRKNRSRGFERLRRIATEEGWDLTAYPRAISPTSAESIDQSEWLNLRSTEDE